MNLSLERYVSDAKRIADAEGLPWSIPVDATGNAPQESTWNLTEIAKESSPPTVWLSDLGTDAPSLEILSSESLTGPVRKYQKRALSSGWQDLLKACVIDQLRVRKNTAGCAIAVVRSLRILATCSGKDDPANITGEDVSFAIQIARKLGKSEKFCKLICGVVRHVLDANHLTNAGPLFPLISRDVYVDKRIAAYRKSEAEIRDELQLRKRAERLPERRAFWELLRIVFCEQPRSFVDAIRFAILKVLILTGMRDGEAALVPVDWKRVVQYVDAQGRPADESGGISRELRLRYFGEKQRVKGEDGTILYETSLPVPLQFEELIEESLDEVKRLTEPLRQKLRAQVESGRILPQFDRSFLLTGTSLYTILTGNPFVLHSDLDFRKKMERRYKNSFDPSVLSQLSSAQSRGVERGKTLSDGVYSFFNLNQGMQARDSLGRVVNVRELRDKPASRCYYQVADVENYIKADKKTKLSDTVPFRLGGGKLQTYELLFLMPKCAHGDTKEGGICDITRYFSVGRFDVKTVSSFLAKRGNHNIFAVYGKTDEDRHLRLRPHSLRHLMNTELFRRAVADTIITKRFNRRNVTQSYEYDHRILLEEMDRIAVPAAVEAQLSEKSETLFRILKSGKARGPVVERFELIQRTQGEVAAVEYLSAEAPGLHSTPYGDCISDFTTAPCKTHVECFNGCTNLVATDVEANTRNLLQLKARLEIAISVLEQRFAQIEEQKRSKLSNTSVESLAEPTSLTNNCGSIEPRVATNSGIENQLAHAKVRLDGVNRLLATPPGQLVFPDGKDLYAAATSRRETVLDTFM